MNDITNLLGKIYNGDCLEFMRQLPDKCVDLVLTDPPYGIKRFENGIGKNDRHTVKSISTAFNNNKPTEELFAEIFRISKWQVIWGMNNYQLPNSEYFIVWDKFQTVPNFASAELAWTNIPKPAQVFRYTIHQHNQTEKFHPTQKPLPLFEWILREYKPVPSMVVFDPFMGSGTTAIACERGAYKWFGCELEPKYCEIANKRIEAERAQLKLF